MLNKRTAGILKRCIIHIVTSSVSDNDTLSVVFLAPEGVICEESHKEKRHMATIIETIDPKAPSREDLQALLNELKRLKEVDIRTVNRATLVDIKTVRIKTELPLLARTIDYIKQIKNPYCYLVGNTAVKVSFLGERTINDCITDALFGGGLSNPEVPRYDAGGGILEL